MSAARKTDSSGSSVSPGPSTPSEGIHRCDTVPPPDGEADPYSAPTKVGPMARGLIDKLMAQAEAAPRTKSVPPPKSGERPAVPEPVTNEPPVLVLVPTAPAIPRIYSDADDGENLGPRQSGATQLLAVNVVKAPQVGASPAPSGPPAALPSAALSGAPPTFAAQIDAYRASLAPAHNSSGAKLVVVTALIVALGIAALYFVFATA